MSKAYAFTVEPSGHAELSASSAERWISCPGSVALSKGLPNHGSKFAAEGTAAHYIAAECQRDGGRAERWAGKTALVEGFEIGLDDDLCEGVQEYLDDIKTNEQPGDIAVVEQSFTPALKKLHPSFGGSGDRVMWRESERLLRVTDLKFGAGVAVDVDDNKQLKVYALGALLSNSQYNADKVELRIAQPRCDHEAGRFRSYCMPAFDLIEYAGELVDAAKKTEEFGADLVPSPKACKWCPAFKAKKCPAADKQNHALIAATFNVVHPAKYSKEQIAEFLAAAPLVEAQISAVREFAYQEALKGEGFPGWKIVEKRATRKWADEEEAKKTFGNAAFYTTPELKSPAKIEAIVGKKAFKTHEAALVEKKSSGMTLVPASDPRPPAQVAQLEHFQDVSAPTAE